VFDNALYIAEMMPSTDVFQSSFSISIEEFEIFYKKT